MRFIHRVALPILFVMTVSSLGYAQGTFQGLWESSFGLLDLKQDGMRVSGAYHCCGVGRLEGDIIGNQLEFSWQDAVFGTGWGVFVMSADGERLDGLWGFESDAEPRGEWLAEKFHEPNFIGARTLWSVGGEEMQLGAALQGSAELYIAEDRVVGVLEGVYVLNDPNQRSGFPIFNFLEGSVAEPDLILNWKSPLDGSKGQMTLHRIENRLEGMWHSEDNAGNITFLATGATITLESHAERSSALRVAEQLIGQAANRHDQGDFRQALNDYRQAAALLRAIDDKNRLSRALHGLGLTYMALQNLEAARQQFLEVLDIYDAVDIDALCLVVANLKVVNVLLGLPEDSGIAVQLPCP